jgi:hypothetical protein
MARNRRKKTEVTDSQPDDGMTPSADNQTASYNELLLSPVGFTRAPRPYYVLDKYAIPPVVLRQCMPFAAFRGGFRDSSEDSTNDTFAAQYNWDPEGVDGTSLFTPIVGMKATLDAMELEAATPYAWRFVTSIWPFYDRLFRTSLKQAGTDVTFNSFVAITSLEIELVSLLMDVISYINLGEPTDHTAWRELSDMWSKVYQIQTATPKRKLESNMAVAMGLPCMRGMIQEVIRMKSPFMTTFGRGTINVPLEYVVYKSGSVAGYSQSLTNLFTRIEVILTVLRSEYADELAAMKRHMPYTLADAGLGTVLPVIIDPFKSDGLLNSTLLPRNVSGNEGDPTESTLLMSVDASEIGFLPYDLSIGQPPDSDVANQIHTVMPDAIPLLSLMSQTLYITDSDAVDAEFALLAPHLWGNAIIPSLNPNGVLMIHTLFDDITDLDDTLIHLVESLSIQRASIGGTDYYLPFAKKVSIDIDETLKGLYALMDSFHDHNVVGSIDKLSQTSAAPVTLPEIRNVR